ncbi:MAG: hypothetical protein ACREOQ_03910 [Gemmatimonadales bacterium]
MLQLSGGTGGRGKVRKRAATVAALVGLGLASGSLSAFGALTPDPVPNVYAGAYALFYNGAFAGPIHALSGCTPDIPITRVTQTNPNGSTTTRAVAGPSSFAPCQLEIGLGMSQRFRDAVTSALKETPKGSADVAIARLNDTGTAVASELELRGYVSDVTLPTMHIRSESDPSWLRVELVSQDGKATKVTNPLRRTLGSMQDDPIEAGRPGFATLTGVDPAGLVEADPVAITRADATQRIPGVPTTVLPGRLDVASPRLGVAEGSKTVGQLSSWFDAQLTGKGASRKDLSISYRSVSGANLFQVTLSGFPAHFDPYERTNGQRVLEVGVDPTVKPSWGASSPG